MATIGKKAAVVIPDAADAPSVQDIIDAYVYLTGRLLVLCQEHLDFTRNGFRWNTLVHREAVGFTSANPNLDVAYSEAWIAVDDHSCTLIEVPPIVGRYYTIHLVDMWGETVANINERTYPHHPAGAFLVCPQGMHVTLPTGSVTERIDLAGRKGRVHVRIALGDDPTQAAELQHRVRVHPTGSPTIDPPLAIPAFAHGALPGVEAFDTALEVLASEPDITPGAQVLQTKVRNVAKAIDTSSAERSRVDYLIRHRAVVAFKKHVTAMGTIGNGWVRPKRAGHFGNEWHLRSVANLTGMWANSHEEVVAFGNGIARSIDGSDTYTLNFPKGDHPDSHVKYFWSITCLDAENLRVVPNPRHRFLLNSHSRFEMGNDGSLTLYFAPEKPADAPDPNWLPTPPRQPYVLTWRSYGPDPFTVSGQWFPPPLKRGFHRRTRKRDVDEPDAK